MEIVETRERVRFNIGCREFVIMSDGALMLRIYGGYTEIEKVRFWRAREAVFYVAIIAEFGYENVLKMLVEDYRETQKLLKKYYEEDLPALEVGDSHILEFTD